VGTWEINREERGMVGGDGPAGSRQEPELDHVGSHKIYTAPRRFTQDLHGATFQKTAFFIVTAVKTSNLTQVICTIVYDPDRVDFSSYIFRVSSSSRYLE
jgi:hypothetical protein